MPYPDWNKKWGQGNKHLNNTRTTFTQCTKALCLQASSDLKQWLWTVVDLILLAPVISTMASSACRLSPSSLSGAKSALSSILLGRGIKRDWDHGCCCGCSALLCSLFGYRHSPEQKNNNLQKILTPVRNSLWTIALVEESVFTWYRCRFRRQHYRASSQVNCLYGALRDLTNVSLSCMGWRGSISW